MKVKVTQSCPTLRPHGLYSPRNSPGQNTGVGSLSLPQGIFPTQGLNPGLPHCRWILYHLSHQGSPRIPEWVAYPFSRGSSQPRNRARVSRTAGGSSPTEPPGKPFDPVHPESPRRLQLAFARAVTASAPHPLAHCHLPTCCALSSFTASLIWAFPFFILESLYCLKKDPFGTSLVVQWLGLHAFTAEGPGLIPSRGA